MQRFKFIDFMVIEVQWNLSITDTIGESQFVRYREVSLVERFDLLMTIITIIVIHIHALLV